MVHVVDVGISLLLTLPTRSIERGVGEATMGNKRLIETPAGEYFTLVQELTQASARGFTSLQGRRPSRLIPECDLIASSALFMQYEIPALKPYSNEVTKHAINHNFGLFVTETGTTVYCGRRAHPPVLRGVLIHPDAYIHAKDVWTFEKWIQSRLDGKRCLLRANLFSPDEYASTVWLNDSYTVSDGEVTNIRAYTERFNAEYDVIQQLVLECRMAKRTTVFYNGKNVMSAKNMYVYSKDAFFYTTYIAAHIGTRHG